MHACTRERNNLLLADIAPIVPLRLVQVGFVQSEHQAERKSGVEAWSMRVHDKLVVRCGPLRCNWKPCTHGQRIRLVTCITVAGCQAAPRLQSKQVCRTRPESAPPASLPLQEIPFPDFLAQFAEDKVPFHRVAYYKQQGQLVWCAWCAH